VRGERFAAVALETDYGNGMLRNNVVVIGLDATCEASLTGGSRHSWDAGRRVASMSDEPSNAASETFAGHVAFLNEFGNPPEGLVRTWLADDFVYEDRRGGPSFPNADAESYPKLLGTAWETGAGEPRFQGEILGVRGERFAAVVVTVDYGNGMLFESIHLVALDATLSLVQRVIDFDVEDVDSANAELDRLQSQDGAS